MSIKIGNYSFEGPFADPASLKNVSGVYAVPDPRNRQRQLHGARHRTVGGGAGSGR
jgi:hypothetical protein